MIAPLNSSVSSQDNTPVSAPDHTEVRGRFNQYTSGFWALALPALSARYIGRFIDATGILGKVDPSRPSLRYAGLAGSWMLFNTGLYAANTYADMKRMLSETVSYETGKNPNDIGYRDMAKSDNEIVQRTMSNFVKRTAMRTAVDGSFFVSFLMPKKWRDHLRANKADAVDLGVGVTGAYLYSDVIGRKVTFFEALQNFIDRKINHSDAVGEVITDNDLMNLYATHMRDGVKSKHLQGGVLTQRMDTLAWKQDQVMFGRMAELMNETYSNAPNKENANFTVPKLLYLLGHDLIRRDHINQSLAYIEIANKYGIPSVKQVKLAVDHGYAFSEAIKQFPVRETPLQPGEATSNRVANFLQDRTKNYVERLNQEQQQPEVRTL